MEDGTPLEDLWDSTGVPVQDPTEFRKPKGFKGWGRCPGEANLKKLPEMLEERAHMERAWLQPMRAFCRAYIRQTGKRPMAADLCSGSGGHGLALFMCGFNVIGYDIDKQHAKNYPSRSEMEKLPWGLELEHTISFRLEDVFTADLSMFDVAIASPPCSPTPLCQNAGEGKRPVTFPS